jgi:hypothetical protein
MSAESQDVRSTWHTIEASEVQVGDTIRIRGGEELQVSRVEPSFFGNPTMLAFIEDTATRWQKRAMPVDAEVDVLLT